MSADYSNTQPQQQPRKGLAVASLVLGIVSVPTLGLLGVGAVTALVLGATALKRIKKEPAIYGGKEMAIAGIVTSVVLRARDLGRTLRRLRMLARLGRSIP